MRKSVDQVAKLARVLAASDPEDAYRALTTHWDDATSSACLGMSTGKMAKDRSCRRSQTAGSRSKCSWSDLVGYLPDDILAKVDRAAMAVSLETRVPFLDRAILDLAWRSPLDAKLRGNQTKWACARSRPPRSGSVGPAARDGFWPGRSGRGARSARTLGRASSGRGSGAGGHQGLVGSGSDSAGLGPPSTAPAAGTRATNFGQATWSCSLWMDRWMPSRC